MKQFTAAQWVQADMARWPSLFGHRDPVDRVANPGPQLEDFGVEKMREWLKAREAWLDARKYLPWSALTDEQKRWTWQKVFDQTLVVLGNGQHWQENGCPHWVDREYGSSQASDGVLNVKPWEFADEPMLEFSIQHFHWYPVYDYFGLYQFIGNHRTRETVLLEPSFARAGFQILKAHKKYGISAGMSTGGPEADLKAAQQSIEQVNRLLPLWLERYPYTTTPEEVAELVALPPDIHQPEGTFIDEMRKMRAQQGEEDE